MNIWPNGSDGSRGGAGGARPPSPLILEKKNEKTKKEEKPAGQAIFANQFCFNMSKKPPPPAQGLDPPVNGTVCHSRDLDLLSEETITAAEAWDLRNVGKKGRHT